MRAGKLGEAPNIYVWLKVLKKKKNALVDYDTAASIMLSKTDTLLQIFARLFLFAVRLRFGAFIEKLIIQPIVHFLHRRAIFHLIVIDVLDPLDLKTIN